MEGESYLLMDKYNAVTNQLDAEVELNITDDMDQADIDLITDDIYGENVRGEIWKLDVTKVIKTLTSQLISNPEDFIEKYV